MDETPSGVIYSRRPLWVEALTRVLATVPVTIVGAATTESRCLELVEAREPELLVTDTDNATFETDLRFVESCRRSSPGTRVVLLSDRRDPAAIQAALDAGVSAYTFKTASLLSVAAAVRKASEYSTCVGPTHDERIEEITVPPPAAQDNGGLTPRELEILGLVARGYSNARVAQMLWVTEQTVKFHLSNIYRKLDVGNRTEASRWAHTSGLATAVAAQATDDGKSRG